MRYKAQGHNGSEEVYHVVYLGTQAHEDADLNFRDEGQRGRGAEGHEGQRGEGPKGLGGGDGARPDESITNRT